MQRAVVDWMGVIVLGLAIGAAPASSLADEPAQAQEAPEGSAEKPKLETLLHAELEGVQGTEVIVSRVTIPPRTALPKHWHPGEEFAYILEGSASLWLEGEQQPAAKVGDVLKVPLKQVHTAITGDEGATILVFRVHEKGQPERVPVE